MAKHGSSYLCRISIWLPAPVAPYQCEMDNL